MVLGPLLQHQPSRKPSRRTSPETAARGQAALRCCTGCTSLQARTGQLTPEL
eukprot:CAMPEP_0115287034 /NCGR_PEP_ID=MMETSP0270-20121206/62243_1 /TAXON_ID=71861 /ORGANISM="Scrippsiella trochoidea, Strain CCMP3099" /LENGTH=51 /DNA_ID=CAMNT_0002704085 /DNA_START=30 /DNA_END=185 /DNA_ORIENTATION=+